MKILSQLNVQMPENQVDNLGKKSYITFRNQEKFATNFQPGLLNFFITLK